MKDSRKDTLLIIFAKAPVPGRVKTRLIPALGAKGAACLYRRMLRNALDIATQAGLGDIELYCTPDTRHEVFRDLSRQFPIVLRRQQGPDLGSRMYQAMADALRRYVKVILIGSDCPQLSVSDLIEAEANLCGRLAVVLGPASDGGYVLIGARELDPRLFSDIPWGSAQVLELTRKRIRQLGWQWRELRVLQDIDRPRDLRTLPDGFA